VTIEHANAVVVQANVPDNGALGRTKVGDSVYKGDVVQTGADGNVGITFTDGTAFNLSSNARKVNVPLDRLNSVEFDVPLGSYTNSFNTIVKIDTPVATLGVRGTTPHIEISDDGTVRFSTLIEENKDKVTEKRGNIEENKRGVPVKRQARRDNPDKNVDIKIKTVKSP
jgi:hypothetical protein